MDINPCPIQIINDRLWLDQHITLGVLRLDLLHPFVSGNKWYKLHRNIAEYQSSGSASILTFGGAYSNHLHATAHYCHLNKLLAIGIVRGEELNEYSNATLTDCARLGMKLHFLSRDEYHQKENGATVQGLIQNQKIFIIPEGGDNPLGRFGAADIVRSLPTDWDHIAMSVGTGTTINGMMDACEKKVSFYGFSSVRNDFKTRDKCIDAARGRQFQWIEKYHFGGFGRYDQDLIRFMIEFKNKYDLPLDVVYTAKMMYGVMDMLDNNLFPTNAKLLCVHTGGLQGNRSIPDLAAIT